MKRIVSLIVCGLMLALVLHSYHVQNHALRSAAAVRKTQHTVYERNATDKTEGSPF